MNKVKSNKRLNSDNDTQELSPIHMKPQQNYVAYFLTFACNLRCPYCINWHGDKTEKSPSRKHSMATDEWIKAANRLLLRDDLLLTLQGGEPTLYKGFYDIVNKVKESIRMDLLTNMFFDVDEFIKKAPVWRFTREAPYAAIRVSYHPGQNDIEELIAKTLKLQDAGFRVGIYSLAFPDPETRRHVEGAKDNCLKQGIDFRYKEFIGGWKGTIHGMYKYDGSVLAKEMKYCECKTTELIVDPAGYVYRCHADLYKARSPIAHILDRDFNEEAIDKFRDCDKYGGCNPCDVKVKTNRFQVFGHTSVEIRNVRNNKIG